MPLDPTVKMTVSRKLEEYEGRYNHLYLDTKGKVTVGIGHMIPNRVAIAPIMLYTLQNGQPSAPATLTQKQAEYDRILKQKRNYRAGWYKQFCTLMMKDIDIDVQREKHINSFYSELTTIYNKKNGFQNNFDQMFSEVQMALFDMIFNLGAPNLKNLFLKFNDAIKKEDWERAAIECNRPDVSPSRNNYVKQLLMTAKNKSSAVTPQTGP